MSVESVDVPVTVEALTPSVTTVCPVHDDSVFAAGSSVGDRFEEVAGSKFVAMFAPALFDEMMHPAVSASLVDTARIRDNPLGRARRTAASDQLAFFAHSADRAEEMQRLVELHRDVKGVQPDGVRYSAMSPEPWNWNLYSIFFMHRGVFMTVTGEKLTPAENQEIWDRYRTMTAGLQMRGQAGNWSKTMTRCAPTTTASWLTCSPTPRPWTSSWTPRCTRSALSTCRGRGSRSSRWWGRSRVAW